MDDDPYAIPREHLRAWWHETIDIMFDDGLTPVRMLCDNAAHNRISIAYMTPDPEWKPKKYDAIDSALATEEFVKRDK